MSWFEATDEEKKIAEMIIKLSLDPNTIDDMFGSATGFGNLKIKGQIRVLDEVIAYFQDPEKREERMMEERNRKILLKHTEITAELDDLMSSLDDVMRDVFDDLKYKFKKEPCY